MLPKVILKQVKMDKKTEPATREMELELLSTNKRGHKQVFWQCNINTSNAQGYLKNDELPERILYAHFYKTEDNTQITTNELEYRTCQQ